MWPSARRMASSFVTILVALVAIFCIYAVPKYHMKGREYNAGGYGPDATDYGTVIAIDLGNTCSRVGIYLHHRVEIITNEYGHFCTPSWVAFGDNDILVGDAAKKTFDENSENTVFDVVRLLGRTMTELDMQQNAKHWPFKVKVKDGKPVINVQYRHKSRDFTPEEISGLVLAKMKEMAQDYLDQEVTHAVVTVPIHFKDTQRQAVKDAGAHAGLTILRVINEPTAAACAYSLDKEAGEQHVLVYDLGGSTLDVSLLLLDDGVFEVLATAGDSHLGGTSFDDRMVDFFMKGHRMKTSIDVSWDFSALERLKRQVEEAKWALSIQQSTQIDTGPLQGGHRLQETITRTEFEELNIDLFLKTLRSVDQVLAEGNLKREEVDKILLIGGSARIPKLHELLKVYFGREPVRGDMGSDEAVVHGASLLASYLTDEYIPMGYPVDVSLLTLGIETSGGYMARIIPRHTVIPTRKIQNFSTVTDNQTTAFIRVFQGERPMAKDNHLLGELILADISPAPHGVPQIEVTFEIDPNRGLKISVNTGTGGGMSRSLVLCDERGQLSWEDIDRMIAEAEQFAVEEEAHWHWARLGPLVLPPGPQKFI